MPDARRSLRQTGQFKRDAKRAQKQGRPLEKIRVIAEALVADQPLESRLRDHALSEAYSGARECHVEPDWLLVYTVSPEELVLVRCGTHADLFGT